MCTSLLCDELSEPGFGGIYGIIGITAKYINWNETKKFSAKPLRPSLYAEAIAKAYDSALKYINQKNTSSN